MSAGFRPLAPGEWGLDTSISLDRLLPMFHEEQARRWARVEEASEELLQVRTRIMQVDRRQVTVQWNPRRRANTTAAVDPDSLRARPCFLCPENQPPEERALAWGRRLVLQTNPSPVIPLHMVLTHREHRPQALLPVLDDALHFARDAGPGFTLLYNGPEAGASAPDHLHLQVVEAGHLPAEDLMIRGPGSHDVVLAEREALRAWSARNTGGRAMVLFDGHLDAVSRGIELCITAAPTREGGEGSFNLLLAGRSAERLTALLLLRRAHRPACFFKADPERILVSPGAVDMAGLIITVRREDFDRLNPSIVSTIFAETSLEPAARDALERRLSEELRDA